MNPSSRFAAVLSATLLVVTLPGGPGYSDSGSTARGAGSPDEQDLLITGATTIYPNRLDATEPHGTAFTFVPTQAGRWILKVYFSNAKTRTVQCTDLEESTSPVQWRWDGFDGDFKAPPRGRAYAELTYSQFGGCRSGDLVGQSDWVRVVNSTGFARQGDRSDGASVRHVDLSTWLLSNGARQVVAETRFYQTQRRDLLDYFFILIGTTRTPRDSDTYAYQITYIRNPPPGWSKWMLGYTTPGRFDTKLHRIRCRGFDNNFAGRRIIVTIPKRCLDRSNHKLKMGVVSVQDRHGHSDRGGSGTEFVHYSAWSIYRPVR